MNLASVAAQGDVDLPLTPCCSSAGGVACGKQPQFGSVVGECTVMKRSCAACVGQGDCDMASPPGAATASAGDVAAFSHGQMHERSCARSGEVCVDGPSVNTRLRKTVQDAFGLLTARYPRSSPAVSRS